MCDRQDATLSNAFHRNHNHRLTTGRVRAALSSPQLDAAAAAAAAAVVLTIEYASIDLLGLRDVVRHM